MSLIQHAHQMILNARQTLTASHESNDVTTTQAVSTNQTKTSASQKTLTPVTLSAMATALWSKIFWILQTGFYCSHTQKPLIDLRQTVQVTVIKVHISMPNRVQL
jgi:hypothetical protein